MKSLIKFSVPAIVMATAMPTAADTIAGCITAHGDRNGILGFDDSAIVKSEMDNSVLREAAE